jgi:Zn-dependent peptidase ImmA (M78 family)/transcriptional regulator with XRE-family HTH domain
MVGTDIARLNGAVMQWARARAGLGVSEFAAKLGKGHTEQQIQSWESGISFPTFSQAEKIAMKLKVPLAVLFMREPPNEIVPLPDLRTFFGRPQEKPSIEFMEVLNYCIVRQQWYREDREDEGAKALPFVGRSKLSDSVRTVAADIAKTLSLTHQFRQECGTWEEFLTRFVQQAENLGILVMRGSVVRHASTRTLQVSEFRGFVISDRIAPLVFINSRDARAAQISTLAHELAHIWIEESGISNPDPRKRSAEFTNPIERFCNEVAAEMLIPESSLNGLWNRHESIDSNIRKISSFHRVSAIVAIIRARDLDRVTIDTASSLIEKEYARFKNQADKQAEKDGGPSFWQSFTRSSARFVEAVVGALERRRVLHLEAAKLLGLKLGTLAKYLATRTAEK